MLVKVACCEGKLGHDPASALECLLRLMNASMSSSSGVVRAAVGAPSGALKSRADAQRKSARGFIRVHKQFVFT
jgi:hypothetical protein